MCVDWQDAKVINSLEIQRNTGIKKSFENIRCIPSEKYKKIFMTKKDIEMANLKRVTKGSGLLDLK